jgi:hypothetical protein
MSGQHDEDISRRAITDGGAQVVNGPYLVPLSERDDGELTELLGLYGCQLRKLALTFCLHILSQSAYSSCQPLHPTDDRLLSSNLHTVPIHRATPTSVLRVGPICEELHQVHVRLKLRAFQLEQPENTHATMCCLDGTPKQYSQDHNSVSTRRGIMVKCYLQQAILGHLLLVPWASPGVPQTQRFSCQR